MTEREPDVPQAFKDYVATRGWTYRAEWNWPYTDPETGATYEGYWSLMIYREELIGDDLHFRALEFDPTFPNLAYEGAWHAFVDLAQAEWDRYKANLAAA